MLKIIKGEVSKKLLKSRNIHILMLRILALIMFSGIAACNFQNDNKELNIENLQKGDSIFRAVGCNRCHSVSSSILYGPFLNSILNVQVFVNRKGKTYSVNVDREYIERSIRDPDFEKVLTFELKKMPKPELSDEEVDLLTDYIISLSQIKN